MPTVCVLPPQKRCKGLPVSVYRGWGAQSWQSFLGGLVMVLHHDIAVGDRSYKLTPLQYFVGAVSDRDDFVGAVSDRDDFVGAVSDRDERACSR